MRTVLVGIGGGSGAGKTTLARHLSDHLPGAATLAFDAYYRDLAHLPVEERARTNFDHPDALDVDLFRAHLDHLRDGRPIDVPTYDFTTHTRAPASTRVDPVEHVIVDGILLLAFPEIAARLDVRVYIDVPEQVRFERRLARDVSERGRRPDDVERQFHDTVRPMHDRYVEPSRRFADVVVRVGDPYPEVSRRLAERVRDRSAALVSEGAGVDPSQLDAP